MPAVACLAVLAAACDRGDSSMPTLEEDLAAIGAFNERYVGAINDGDVETLSSLTTDGHIMLMPNRPPLVGKAPNVAALRSLFEGFEIDETWTPVETEIDGDLAYQRGTFTVVSTPKAGGAASTTSGSFLRIYRRQPDGEWRMTRDMFNGDAPPATD
jgi:ketosteroid isomerase-like protein